MPIRRSPNGPHHPVHSLVAIARNRWSQSIGTTGRNQSEQVVAINRCAHLGASERRQPPVCDHGEIDRSPVAATPARPAPQAKLRHAGRLRSAPDQRQRSHCRTGPKASHPGQSSLKSAAGRLRNLPTIRSTTLSVCPFARIRLTSQTQRKEPWSKRTNPSSNSALKN